MTPKYTPEEFEKRVRLYHRDCEETKNVFPDEAGLLNFLDIEDDEYNELRSDKRYARAILWAKRRRTSWLERQMVVNNKAAMGCMNALKQEKNGGYSDRGQQVNTERKLIVKLEGMEDFNL